MLDPTELVPMLWVMQAVLWVSVVGLVLVQLDSKVLELVPLQEGVEVVVEGVSEVEEGVSVVVETCCSVPKNTS